VVVVVVVMVVMVVAVMVDPVAVRQAGRQGSVRQWREVYKTNTPSFMGYK
jgi:hypothetical protein